MQNDPPIFTSIRELSATPIEIKRDPENPITLSVMYNYESNSRGATVEGFPFPVAIDQSVVFKESDGEICGTGKVVEINGDSFKVILD